MSGSTRVRSELDKDLDCLAIIHCPIAVGHSIKTRGSVEHAARFDSAVQNVWKQLRRQEARRLMLGEDFDASSTGYRVGYDDA